jgi:hypothetical protein
MTLCRLAVTVFSLTLAQPIPSKSNRPNGLRRSGSNPHCYWAQTAKTTQQPFSRLHCRGLLAFSSLDLEELVVLPAKQRSGLGKLLHVNADLPVGRSHHISSGDHYSPAHLNLLTQ